MHPRFIGISLEHPGATERRNGVGSTARLAIDRNLRSGKLDDVPMGEGDLVRVIEEAARALRVLQDLRGRTA